MRSVAFVLTAFVLLSSVPTALSQATLPVEIRVRDGEDTPLRDVAVRVGANVSRTDDAGIARFQLTPGEHLAYVAGDNSFLHTFTVRSGMGLVEMQFARVVGEIGTAYLLKSPGNDAEKANLVAPGDYELRAWTPTTGLIYIPRLTLRGGDFIDLTAPAPPDRATLVIVPHNVADAGHRFAIEGGDFTFNETATRMLAWLSPGSYEVFVRPLGPQHQWDVPTVNDDVVQVTLTAGQTRMVDPAYGLIHVVGTRPNATAIAGARVHLSNGMSLTTGAGGDATFVTRSGSYDVTFDHDVDDKTRTTVSDGGTAIVRFDYGEIRIHGHNGTADARAVDGTTLAVTSTTDASDRASLVVPPGMYDVALRNATATVVYRGVIVAEGQLTYVPTGRAAEPPGTPWENVTAPEAEFPPPPPTPVSTPTPATPSGTTPTPTPATSPTSTPTAPTDGVPGAELSPDETPGAPLALLLAALALVAVAVRGRSRRG